MNVQNRELSNDTIDFAKNIEFPKEKSHISPQFVNQVLLENQCWGNIWNQFVKAKCHMNVQSVNLVLLKKAT